MRHFLWFLILSLFSTFPLSAQMADAPFVSWEQFLEEWLHAEENELDEGERQEQEERLLELAARPMQLNRVGREQLLQLPFLDEEQVDSLLSCRERRRGFRHLGELQTVSRLDYYSRCYLSLFVRCDSAYPLSAERKREIERKETLSYKFRAGSIRFLTRLDIPLYSRSGYHPKKEITASNYYFGSPLRHIARYRYHYRTELAYGINIEKDPGEPVAKSGFYPYDYISGYFLLRPRKKPWAIALGDYELRGGRGLLFGRQLFAQRAITGNIFRAEAVDFRAHTGMDENNYFRGAAASYRLGSWSGLAFVSYKGVDGRLNEAGDTVLSQTTTGLHRTFNEIAARHSHHAFTAGAQVGWSTKQMGLFATAYTVHFDTYVNPPLKDYNPHYFRGRSGGAGAVYYYYKGSRWMLQGEVASDQGGHFATEQLFSWQPHKQWKAQLQLRHFSKNYTSLYGSAIQQGSRVANEEGILLSAQYAPQSRRLWTAYVDLFRFPGPTYYSHLGGAKGIEAALQYRQVFPGGNALQCRYRWKARQRNITGVKGTLEYRHTHRLRVAWEQRKKAWEMHYQADVSYAMRQTGKQSWGGMASLRSGWKPAERWQFKAFLATFYTQDFDAAVYAYEPQLPFVSSFPSFSDAGARLAALVQWTVRKGWHLGLRYGGTCYFNKEEQSSGPDHIASRWKNDLTLQLIWQPR